jgi:hypothetical protein
MSWEMTLFGIYVIILGIDDILELFNHILKSKFLHSPYHVNSFLS